MCAFSREHKDTVRVFLILSYATNRAANKYSKKTDNCFFIVFKINYKF